jgi:hypothetical protein
VFVVGIVSAWATDVVVSTPVELETVLDAPPPGVTVWLRPGTYAIGRKVMDEQVTLRGLAPGTVELRPSPAAWNELLKIEGTGHLTLVDLDMVCTGMRCVEVVGNASATLERVWLSDGETNLPLGGGLVGVDTTGGVTVRQSDLRDGLAHGGAEGGLIRVADGDLTIANSRLSNGVAIGTDGGGVRFEGEYLHVEKSLFELSTAGDDGGALSSTRDGMVDRSAFVDNTATDRGGALDVERTLISRSIFCGNEADAGGGVALREASALASTLETSVLLDNSAVDGGGVFIGRSIDSTASPTVRRLTLHRNGGATSSAVAFQPQMMATQEVDDLVVVAAGPPFAASLGASMVVADSLVDSPVASSPTVTFTGTDPAWSTTVTSTTCDVVAHDEPVVPGRGAFGGMGVVDADGDGLVPPFDCDDTNPLIPAPSDVTCDGVDDDCDRRIDEDAPVVAHRVDADGDGIGEGPVVEVCALPGGRDLLVVDTGDCDVADALPTRWYTDQDGDGHGVTADFVDACAAPPDHVALDGDCDDTDATVFPGAADDTCDGVDNDCDDAVDEDATVVVRIDADQDGFAGDATRAGTCDEEDPPPGDCDDRNALVNPAAEEVCDGLDRDCDGDVDEGCVPGALQGAEAVDLGVACATGPRVGVGGGFSRRR